MIRKSGNRFSEKIMLKQKDEIMLQSEHDLGTFLALKIGSLPAVGRRAPVR
jgi:hypothetical protein